MSSADTVITTSAIARTAEATIKATAAQLGDKKRGDPVLRLSIDWLSPEAMRSRLVGDGTYADECDCQEVMEEIVIAWQAESVASGPARYRGDAGLPGVRVFQTLAADMRKNRNGRSDLAYSQIAARIGAKYDSTMDGYHAIEVFGAIGYVRRTQATGAPKQFGLPQRQQISSVAYLTPSRLTGPWRAMYDERIAARRAARVAARHRKAAKEKLEQAVAERQSDAVAGGTAPRRRSRPPGAFAAAKMNPAAACRIETKHAAAIAASQSEEERTAAWVSANAESLRARMLARCG